MLILDTMVVSERTKGRPNPRVQAWLNSVEPKSQFISAVTVGEIRFGVDRMQTGDNKRRLESWLAQMIPFFGNRILPVDRTVAERWGRLRAEVRRTVSLADALIAATAHVHSMSVATRNVADFSDLGVRVVNPWD